MSDFLDPCWIVMHYITCNRVSIHCTEQHFNIWWRTLLNYNSLNSTALHCVAYQCNTLHIVMQIYILRNITALNSSEQYCTIFRRVLHCIARNSSALHCIDKFCSALPRSVLLTNMFLLNFPCAHVILPLPCSSSGRTTLK